MWLHATLVSRQGLGGNGRALASTYTVFDVLPASVAPLQPPPPVRQPQAAQPASSSTSKRLRVAVVGSTTFDGQKAIWTTIARAFSEPESEFASRFEPVRYVTFSGGADTVQAPAAAAGMPITSVLLSAPVDALEEASGGGGELLEAPLERVCALLVRVAVEAQWQVDEIAPPWAARVWHDLVQALRGADIVVYGNADATDVIVVAAARMAGVPVVVMELLDPTPSPAVSAMIAPSQ